MSWSKFQLVGNGRHTYSHSIAAILISLQFQQIVCKLADNQGYHSPTDTLKVLVAFGWMTFSVLHLTSCCLRAHTQHLGVTTVYILKMWR